jgi:hypothetical protein
MERNKKIFVNPILDELEFKENRNKVEDSRERERRKDFHDNESLDD